jgi:hypothetical protein
MGDWLVKRLIIRYIRFSCFAENCYIRGIQTKRDEINIIIR